MQNPILNDRILSLKESATLAINEKAKSMRRAGKKVYHFGFGQSPFPVADPIQEALRKNAGHKEYLPTLGLLELREAISNFYKNYYGYDFDAEGILIGPGSKELIFQAIFVLEGPLLIPGPSWVSYAPQAHIRGKSVYTVLTERKNGYKLTAQDLLRTCDNLLVSRQKILILNNPNNPTGSVYHEKELEELAQVCKEHGIIVISDEIYSLINFSGKPYCGMSRFYPEGTIVTGGLSKSHSAGGYRLGFLAAPKNMDRMLKALMAMVSETFSAVSAPTQYAAIAAYQGDPEVMDYVDRCTRIHQATGKYLWRRFCQLGLNCVEPEGAFYLFPDFEPMTQAIRKRGIQTSTELCDTLLEDYHVAVLPSKDFYCPEDWLACRVASVDYDGEKVLRAAQSVSELDDSFIEKHCPHLKNGCDEIGRFLKEL